MVVSHREVHDVIAQVYDEWIKSNNYDVHTLEKQILDRIKSLYPIEYQTIHPIIKIDVDPTDKNKIHINTQWVDEF